MLIEQNRPLAPARLDPGGWPMVVLEQEPLRGRAHRRCRRAMTAMEGLRARLHGFEREDQPAFARWRAGEFGPLLTRARELEGQIHERRLLIEEVQNEMRRAGGDPSLAYARVRQRQAGTGTAGAPPPPPIGHLSEGEKDAIFREWLREYFGINPDRMADGAYAATFGTFRFHMFGADVREPAAERAPVHSKHHAPTASVRNMYRLLVRRLHPDRRADGDAGACALWHEVQEAHGARDAQRLETLVALSELEAGDLGPRTSLAQLRAAWAELRKGWRALRQSLRAAGQDHAWDFARRGADAALRQRVERDLARDLAKQTATLDYLTRTIASWSAPAPPPPLTIAAPR